MIDHIANFHARHWGTAITRRGQVGGRPSVYQAPRGGGHILHRMRDFVFNSSEVMVGLP